MLPFFAVISVASSLLNPILWTLALCGVLLARRLRWSVWATIGAGAGLAVAGLLLLHLIQGSVGPSLFLHLGSEACAGVIAAGVVLALLRTFDGRKPS